MNSEVLVGIIGLGGAAIGAAAAFLGIVYQQRAQTKQAIQERLTALSEGAVDVLITELQVLQGHAWKRPEAESAERPEWLQEMSEILGRINLASLHLTDGDLRDALEAACLFGFGHESYLQEHVGLRAGRLLMMAMCVEMQKSLGCYLRREPAPKARLLDQAREAKREVLATPLRDA
ncbi:hypothetical protein [Streptomyces sp. NBC_00370]|uniref:hypothetical protein n=1 Tax=Streptomyces sp. NBC_00370 TaxID=2975728 RepID=UPI002E275648